MGVVTPLEYANEPIQRALGGRGVALDSQLQTPFYDDSWGSISLVNVVKQGLETS